MVKAPPDLLVVVLLVDSESVFPVGIRTVKTSVAVTNLEKSTIFSPNRIS